MSRARLRIPTLSDSFGLPLSEPCGLWPTIRSLPVFTKINVRILIMLILGLRGEDFKDNKKKKTGKSNEEQCVFVE